MKKSLLTTVLGLAFGAAFAQDPLVIYNGTSASFLTDKPYTFGDTISVVDSGTTDKAYYVTGKTAGYYIGGIGNAKYTGPGVKAPLGFTGMVATSGLGFTAYTMGTSVKMKVQLKTALGTVYGYEFDLARGKADTAAFTTPLASFKMVVNDNPTGDVVTDDSLATVNEIQFVFSCTNNSGKCTGTVILDNVVMSSLPTSLDDDFISADFTVYPNPNSTGVINLGENAKSYSLSTISGAVVKEGTDNKINVESLEKGIYFVRVGNKTTKVVLN